MNDHNAELLSSISSSFSDQIKSVLESLGQIRINPYYFPEKIDSKKQLENLKNHIGKKNLFWYWAQEYQQTLVYLIGKIYRKHC